MRPETGPGGKIVIARLSRFILWIEVAVALAVAVQPWRTLLSPSALAAYDATLGWPNKHFRPGLWFFLLISILLIGVSARLIGLLLFSGRRGIWVADGKLFFPGVVWGLPIVFGSVPLNTVQGFSHKRRNRLLTGWAASHLVDFQFDSYIQVEMSMNQTDAIEYALLDQPTDVIMERLNQVLADSRR